MIYCYVLEKAKSSRCLLEKVEVLDMDCQIKSIGINLKMKCLNYLKTSLKAYITYQR